MKGARQWPFLTWALVGVPLLYAACAHFAYDGGMLPDPAAPDWVWPTVLGACLLSGVIAVAAMPQADRWQKFVGLLVYVPLFGTILLCLGLVIACGHGDCL